MSRYKYQIWILLYSLLIYLSTIYISQNDLYPFNIIEIHPDILSIVFSFIFVLASFYCVPQKISKPSGLAFWILYLNVYIPTIILVPLINGLTGSSLTFMLCIFSSLCLLSTTQKFHVDGIPRFELSMSFLITIVVCSIFYLTWAVFYSGLLSELVGVIFNNEVGLELAYLLREEYKSAILSNSILPSRLVSILQYILLPWLLSVGLINRSRSVILVSVLGEFAIFSIAGFKSAIVTPIIAITFYYVFFIKNKDISYVIFLVCIPIISGLLIHMSVGVFELLSLARRAVILPGMNSGIYLDFFSKNPNIYYFSQTIGGFEPYDRSVANVIMETYFETEGSMNTHLWATGYARLNNIGVLISSLLLYIFLLTYDSLAANIDFRVSYILIISQVMPIANSGLFSWMLSHGGIILIFILLVHPTVTEETVGK